jgi:hypothetical protein
MRVFTQFGRSLAGSNPNVGKTSTPIAFSVSICGIELFIEAYGTKFDANVNEKRTAFLSYARRSA